MDVLPLIPALDNSFGAWLIGTFVSALLQGMIFHQTHRYFRMYPDDALFLKAWVVVVLAIEIINTALAMHVAFFYMVLNYYNLEMLLVKPVWSFTISPIPGALAAVVVELFFARRLWLIGPRFRLLVVIAVLLNLGFFGCFTALAGLGFKAQDLQSYLDHTWLASLGAGFIGVADVMMTSSLIYVLHSSRTGVKQTNSMLDLLIRYAVSTGLIICIFNILNIAFSIAYPHNWIFAGISVAMTKLYANTFLVALNARRSLLSFEVMRMEQTTQFSSTFLRGVGSATISGWSSLSNGTRLQFGKNTKLQSSAISTTARSRVDSGMLHGEVIELKQMSTTYALEHDLEANVDVKSVEPVAGDSGS